MFSWLLGWTKPFLPTEEYFHMLKYLSRAHETISSDSEAQEYGYSRRNWATRVYDSIRATKQTQLAELVAWENYWISDGAAASEWKMEIENAWHARQSGPPPAFFLFPHILVVFSPHHHLIVAHKWQNAPQAWYIPPQAVQTSLSARECEMYREKQEDQRRSHSEVMLSDFRKVCFKKFKF